MKLIEKIKLITQTLMVVVIVAFGFGMYHLYQNGQVNAQEQETNEIAETLEEITI